MPNPYSAEMRERVIAGVESGASRRETAEHFEISASAAVNGCSAGEMPEAPRPSRAE
jgi:transposase